MACHAPAQQAIVASLVHQKACSCQGGLPLCTKAQGMLQEQGRRPQQASADTCNLCRTMLGTLQPLKQSERQAMLADCAQSCQGALP